MNCSRLRCRLKQRDWWPLLPSHSCAWWLHESAEICKVHIAQTFAYSIQITPMLGYCFIGTSYNTLSSSSAFSQRHKVHRLTDLGSPKIKIGCVKNEGGYFWLKATRKLKFGITPSIWHIFLKRQPRITNSTDVDYSWLLLRPWSTTITYGFKLLPTVVLHIIVMESWAAL